MSILASLAAKFGGQQVAPTKVTEPIPDNSANGPAATAASTAPVVNPIDALGDLWSASQPTAAQASQYLALKPEEIQASAKNMNFASLVTPDHQAAIAGGGEGAAKAVVELMNTLGQAVFAASSMQSGNFVNSGLGKFRSGLDTELPNLIKSNQAKDALFQQNDFLQKPAVAPVAEAVMKQLQAKYPAASQAELVEATGEYLRNAFGGFGQSQTTQTQSKPKEIDWESFL